MNPGSVAGLRAVLMLLVGAAGAAPAGAPGVAGVPPASSGVPPASSGVPASPGAPGPSGAPPGSRAPEPDYHLVDMVVAQVDATVITLSALVAETRLVLLRTGGPELARANYLSQNLLNQVLKSIVHRELILGEARRLKLQNASDRDVEQAIDRIKALFASRAEYERFLDKSGLREPGGEMMRGFDAPATLVGIVLAELQVERYVSPQLRRSGAARKEDVLRCYEANRAQFGGRPLATVQHEIREALIEQDRERAYRALVEQLMRRATVRYADRFEPPPDAPGGEGGLVCPERKAPARPEDGR